MCIYFCSTFSSYHTFPFLSHLLNFHFTLVQILPFSSLEFFLLVIVAKLPTLVFPFPFSLSALQLTLESCSSVFLTSWSFFIFLLQWVFVLTVSFLASFRFVPNFFFQNLFTFTYSIISIAQIQLNQYYQVKV